MAENPSSSWDNPDTDQRVEQLLAQMTLEEKVAFATGDLNFDYGFFAHGLERLGIPDIQMADGPAGVRINKGDVHDGRATALPAPIALAATWDEDLAGDYGGVVGAECRASDHNVSLGPAVDIARVPLGGRTFESYGEDPLLASRIGVGVVRGIQSQGIQACAKHFAINNQEDHRSSIDAIVDERAMHELYLQPFEALVQDGGAASFMGSFNRVGGTYACENPELLRGVLRDRFGFRGWIMSDYGANHSTAPAANAGLDQEQPNEGFWGGQLRAAVENGEVSEATIDEKVRNILRPLIGLGQIEEPVGIGDMGADAHHETARRIAEAGMVLLRNDGLLPLQGARRIALIGPDVDATTAHGGGSSMVKPAREVTPLDGLRAALGADAEIDVVHGTDPVTPGALLPGADPIPSAFFRTPDGEVGLHAEYWTGTEPQGEPFHVRTDRQIDLMQGFHNFPGFNAASARYEPLPGELNGQMSARWSGSLTVPVTGTYRFTITHLGRYSLELDGRLVARSGVGGPSAEALADLAGPGPEAQEQLGEVQDAPETPYGWGDGGEGEAVVEEIAVTLRAGRAYELRLEYSANHPSQGFLLGARLRLGWVPPAGVVSPSVGEAAAAAARADAAVVVVRTYEAEADDRPRLNLPNGQDDLVRAVLAANPRTAVVVMSGAPVDLTAWGAQPAALLQAWFPGQAQGDALAAVLTGAAEPGGRLPLSLPASLDQTPAAHPRTYPGVDGKVHYDEGVLVGYRGLDHGGLDPVYPFGHGLGYTSWEYSDLEVTAAADADAAATGRSTAVATVSFTLTNTGGRAGSTVAQVYIGALPVDLPMPPRQLAGFAKVHLEAGESRRVSIPITARAVSWYDVGIHDWARAHGDVELSVGRSSRDLVLTGSLRA
ncbi:glycoside hydrolase family 3 protein [Brachybacterium hainanense]|uniref:Glycoside hydrolase family 3 protein n=1 Tax=Brachybacterium hainanense TaxID=1541174 RepID=A0ABV6RCH6_9MICO